MISLEVCEMLYYNYGYRAIIENGCVVGFIKED